MRFKANYNKGLLAPNSTNSTIKIIPRIIEANNITNISSNDTINITSPNASVIVDNGTQTANGTKTNWDGEVVPPGRW